jgi:hypothetical protein
MLACSAGCEEDLGLKKIAEDNKEVEGSMGSRTMLTDGKHQIPGQ